MQPASARASSAMPEIPPGLVEALTSAYATLIKRQRTASSAFVRWTSPRRRAHEFCWIPGSSETLLLSGKEARIQAGDPAYETLRKMMAAIELNPYERELLYGYPYLTGQLNGAPVRAPLLTIPILLHADGGAVVIQPNEEMVRFNSLPFRSDTGAAALDRTLERLIESTPHYPIGAELRGFAELLARELNVSVAARLDGHLEPGPTQPGDSAGLTLIDAAACFAAPKAGYFLASDLEAIAHAGAGPVAGTSLGWLIGRRGHEETSDTFGDTRRVYFPFSSNASQRRVALLAEEPSNRIVVVQGPPGTGKSLTIANAVCHLVATGKRVLVCSQKDKALEVVDQMLRGLDLPQLPMTLLRQDIDSRRELRDRLDSVQKTRSLEESRELRDREAAAFQALAREAAAAEQQLARSLPFEHSLAAADRELETAAGVLRRLGAWLSVGRALLRARRHAPVPSDALGQRASRLRADLLHAAVRMLKAGAECRVGEASKAQRNELREFSKLLARSQSNARNFSIFDRLKSEPARCEALLGILPCWIMTPDDVARLFPCEPGLFDVVIIDEASQCDLPSMAPVLYRARQAIIAGDSKQMQAQRFAFTSSQIAAQAWKECGLDRLDPDGWLDPARIDLLHLASHRLDEEAFLDEHYRSLPAIIGFSNQRWYSGRLRVMRDAEDRRVGEPGRPVVSLHRVTEGSVHPGTQENEREAQVLIAALKEKLEHPAYEHATFGVICLFEEQMRLMNELVAEQIEAELRTAHDLVIVNPDGFQGDERDVIFYSLSYDAAGMEQAAISARQADREHIQGMLNVAFTRAREEMHIFHSAEIGRFTMAGGHGAIADWLRYCSDAGAGCGIAPGGDSAEAQSEFEGEVLQALAARGLKTTARYPSCGFRIDIVVEQDGKRIAVECDGELARRDEQGQPLRDHVQRQETLERAGWTVLRIPYRSWRKDRSACLERVLAALARAGEDELAGPEPAPQPHAGGTAENLRLTRQEAAIFRAIRNGDRDYEEVLRSARIQLGLARLGPRIRASLESAVQSLQVRKLISNEDRELFIPEHLKDAAISTHGAPRRRGRVYAKA